MKKLMLMISAAFALLATSCMEHHVTIRLNKDGSGTITEETLLGAQMLAMFEQMAAMGGEGAEAEDPTADMVDEEKAKATAARMGEGVTVAKVEKIDEDGRKGARTVYAFEDINTVKYGFGDGLDDMGDDMGPAGPAEEEEASEPMEFVYKDGVLTLENDGDEAEGDDDAEEGDEEPEEVDPAELAQAKQMLNGMKMSITLEFPGGIEETNATHRDGNTVTLMEMDMGALLEDPEAFARLQAEEPEGPAEMAEILEGIEGMKVEANETLEVKLK